MRTIVTSGMAPVVNSSAVMQPLPPSNPFNACNPYGAEAAAYMNCAHELQPSIPAPKSIVARPTRVDTPEPATAKPASSRFAVRAAALSSFMATGCAGDGRIIYAGIYLLGIGITSTIMKIARAEDEEALTAGMIWPILLAALPFIAGWMAFIALVDRRYKRKTKQQTQARQVVVPTAPPSQSEKATQSKPRSDTDIMVDLLTPGNVHGGPRSKHRR